MGARLDRQLARHEGRRGDRVVAVAQVNEQHLGRLLRIELALGGFEDAVGEGARRAVVHEAQAVQVRNRAGVHHGPALPVREVGGNGHHGVDDLDPGARLGDLHELGEHHGRHLLHGQDRGLVVVRHLHTRRAILELHEHERLQRDLLLHLGLREEPPNQPLHVQSRVLVVRPRNRGGVIAHEPLLALERHHAGILPLRRAIEQDVHSTTPGLRDNAVQVPEIYPDDRHCQ
mmetsp:Transcript_16266/g.47739  ORF Transcript_16266/g.47739 Transcript_16266/m.47739 type:complete len:231 (-) Transcript_16266:26-718(-)